MERIKLSIIMLKRCKHYTLCTVKPIMIIMNCMTFGHYCGSTSSFVTCTILYTCCNPTRIHFTQQNLQAFPSGHLLSTWQGLRSNQGKCIRLSRWTKTTHRHQYKHLTDRLKTSVHHTIHMIESIELMTSSKIVSFQKHTTLSNMKVNNCSKRGLLHPKALMHEDYQCLKVQEVPN